MLVTLYNITTLSKLCERWSCSKDFLPFLWYETDLKLYEVLLERADKSGNIGYVCIVSEEVFDNPDSINYIESELNLVVDLDAVISVEDNCPALRFETVNTGTHGYIDSQCLENNIKNEEIHQSIPSDCDNTKSQKTTNATLFRLKNRNARLVAGYEGAAKLAHAITSEGLKRGINPWTEEEIIDLAGELGVSIKGDCLKAFKAGMPPELVKKDAGARPTNLREEFLDDEAS